MWISLVAVYKDDLKFREAHMEKVRGGEVRGGEVRGGVQAERETLEEMGKGEKVRHHFHLHQST